jgi:predicted transcriptional regulator
MPWPDISRIRERRIALGIKQKDLARLSGVAQPVISRIEKNVIPDPSYRTVRKLFEALESHNRPNAAKEPVAKELMNTNVVTVKPNDLVKDAWTIMKEKGFSQLPVVDERGRIHGGISESALMPSLEGKVEDIMGDSFPLVSKSTQLSTLTHFLQKEPALLVIEKGTLIGIVTKYDLIQNLYEKKPSAFS